jgi:hypothetical protein
MLCIEINNSNNISSITANGSEMGGAYSTHGKMRIACKVLVGKSVENRPLGIPRRGWQDNIRMDLTEMEWESED